jgi:hypothetical protein
MGRAFNMPPMLNHRRRVYDAARRIDKTRSATPRPPHWEFTRIAADRALDAVSVDGRVLNEHPRADHR